jgi:hypothetical protein
MNRVHSPVSADSTAYIPQVSIQVANFFQAIRDAQACLLMIAPSELMGPDSNAKPSELLIAAAGYRGIAEELEQLAADRQGK